MKPKATPSSAQPDFFQIELSSIISSQHPSVRLSAETTWDAFEQQPQPSHAPVMGATGINTRLMGSLHYLKFQHDLSNEDVVAHWLEHPYWQFFGRRQFFSVKPGSIPRA